MSDNARDDENLPPAKRLKTEDKQENVADSGQADTEAKEEKDDEEGLGDMKEEDRTPQLGSIKEEDVGITEYISQHRGVSAVIKQRYSDFIVNEISSSGEVVHLTSTDLPVTVEEAPPEGPVDDVLPAEFVTQLKQVAAGSNPNCTASIPAGDDKEKRLHIHRAVKTAFPALETKTEEKDGVKVITAMLKSKAKDKRQTRQWDWPSSQAQCKFCRFVLYKENKGTVDAIHLIAKNLKVKDNVFSFAGTKDRRGKTTQEVTAFKLHPKKLQDLNKFLRNITLGNFRYVDKQLRLGDLGGNRFTIVLRNVTGEDKDIETGVNSLKTVGFINYYGLQRFGSLHVHTHHVGRALLKEKWEEAVDLIIAGSGDGAPSYRKTWRDTKDPEKTMGQLENRHYMERIVLRSLARRPDDFFGAVQSLPRNSRLMYPHSYQSVVWNIMASRRIQTFGLQPVVGDLVLPPGASSMAPDTDTMEEEGLQSAVEEGQEKNTSRVSRLKPVVLDETTVSQYSIYDVVLPLPGFDVIYPNNEVHSWYKEHLEEDGLDIGSMERKQKDYSLSGSYRAVVVRPTEVEWKTVRYNDVTTSLTLSDIDRINQVEETQTVEDGKLKAVVLSLTLPTSTYATMALREVLKTDTSPAQQAAMNVT